MVGDLVLPGRSASAGTNDRDCRGALENSGLARLFLIQVEERMRVPRIAGVFQRPPTGFPTTMICPKCHTALDLPADFCPSCGASLQRRGGWILAVTAALVLALVIGAYTYVNERFFQRPAGNRLPESGPSREATVGPQAVSPDKAVGKAAPDASELPPVATGDLILRDIAGREMGIYPVAIVSSGWFAFPKRLCIGGHTWQVALGTGRVLAVEGGILPGDEPVGLWQVAAGIPLKGAELSSWTPERPLRWVSLDRSQAVPTVPVSAFERLTYFDRIPLNGEMDEPGYFVQDGNIVGWSFGEETPGGYLWSGNHGFELTPEFYTDDFYRLTFEGGREEAFLLALADESLSDFQRLTALAEAYRLEPRMPPNERPGPAAPAAVQAAMLSLVERLRAQGRTDDLLLLFDAPTLAVVEQPTLARGLMAAAQDAGRYAYAVDVAEMLMQAAAGDPEELREIETLQAGLYREWLNLLILEGDDETLRSVYQEASARFPEDAAIRLAGVELVLGQGNWALAERLLAALDYPPDMRDRASRLQQEITALKSQEGKIVIRFRAGAHTVPVTAALGAGITQRFLIDTGASIVTVPTATIRRLGIDLSDNLPRRLFYSATGVQNAAEVTLPYIEIDGWAVEDIQALVVDLPGQPGVGLLGMNYLRHFRMDLNTDDGLLVLAPR